MKGALKSRVGSGGHAGGVDRLHPAMCSHMWKPGQSRNPAGHSGVDRTWRTAPQCRYFITALIDRIDVGANQIDIRLRPRRLSALLDIATRAFTCGLGPRLNWERASTPTMIEEIRFAADSPLEVAVNSSRKRIRVCAPVTGAQARLKERV